MLVLWGLIARHLGRAIVRLALRKGA
jgi:hypothetical protein